MRRLFILCLLLGLAACGRGAVDRPVSDPFANGYYKVGKPYTIKNVTYYPEYDPAYDEVGLASWYGSAFHAKETANGETFDKNLMTAAHKTMALPSYARVTNLENGRTIKVRVNDRGPFVAGRIIDLSEAAASKLGFHTQGVAKVRVEFLTLAQAKGTPPKATRNTAAQVREVVPVAAAAPVPATNNCAAPVSIVQLGAFADPSRAQALKQKARALGFANIVAVGDPGDQLYRVRTDYLASQSAALAAKTQLRASGFKQAMIRTVAAKEGGCV